MINPGIIQKQFSLENHGAEGEAAEEAVNQLLIAPHDLPNETYHAMPGISSSRLRIFKNQGSYGYWFAHKYPEEKKSKALELGNISHEAILECKEVIPKEEVEKKILPLIHI